MRSAPSLYRCLTARRASSAPLTTPSSGVAGFARSSRMPLVGSACPPVVAMLRPDVKMRGPFTYAAFTALRSDDADLAAQIAHGGKARQQRPLREADAAERVIRSDSGGTCRSRSFALYSPVDMTCMSIRPGMQVCARKSTTVSPAAGGVSPCSTRAIAAPSTTTVMFVRTRPARTSTSRPHAAPWQRERELHTHIRRRGR